MTKRQSLRYVKVYLGLVVVGLIVLCVLAGAILLFDLSEANDAFVYLVRGYFIAILVALPMLAPAFFSFSLVLLGIRRPMPLFNRLADLFPAFIWDELKDPERGK